MTRELGSYNTATTRTHVRFQFSTHAAAGGNVAPSTAFEAADLRIYRANDGAAYSATQRSSSNGITMTSPFDSLTGVHDVDIDLTDNTDAGFYAAGYRYSVVLCPDETVDSQTITGVVLGEFEIGPPPANVTQLAGSTSGPTNLNTIFNTDYATIYDATNKAFLSKLGNFAMGGSSLALTTGAISGTTLTLTGAVLLESGVHITQTLSDQPGLSIVGNGGGAGILCTGGVTGFGMYIGGGGTSGEGLVVESSNGHAASFQAGGTSKHGMLVAGGSAGVSDGLKLMAGTGGVGFRLDALTVSGAVSLSSTLTVAGTTTLAAFTTGAFSPSSISVSGATTLTGAVTATNAGNDIRGIALHATQSAYAPATAANLAVVAAYIDTEVAAILSAVDTEIAAILADTNELQTDWADGGRLDLILDAAGSAGDPWVTTLPGAYGAGTAGKIIGDNLNATVGSRATQTSVDDLPTNAELATALGTADDAVLVQVALVKAKTDLLPSDPADASDIAAAFATVNSTLSTIAGYIDTEVAAIKAKTDLIGTTSLLVADSITAAAISAAAANKLADHSRRRTQANVEASTDGDTLALNSLYGFLQQAQKSSASGVTLTVKKTDGSTTLGTITLTATAGADPITGVS